MKRQTAPESAWIDAEANPPTSGSRVLGLTLGGVLAPTVWTAASAADFVAWAPYPKVSPAIKAKLLRQYPLGSDK